MVLININEGLKEEYSMNKIFSAEYDFSCVRQIARADRFACVLTLTASNEKACTTNPPTNLIHSFLEYYQRSNALV